MGLDVSGGMWRLLEVAGQRSRHIEDRERVALADVHDLRLMVVLTLRGGLRQAKPASDPAWCHRSGYDPEQVVAEVVSEGLMTQEEADGSLADGSLATGSLPRGRLSCTLRARERDT